MAHPMYQQQRGERAVAHESWSIPKLLHKFCFACICLSFSVPLSRQSAGSESPKKRANRRVSQIMKIATHAVAALSSHILLTIGGVDGSGESIAIDVEDPRIFLGAPIDLRASGGETPAPTVAPTPAPTTVDSSIVCPLGLYDETAYLSADCTKAAICDDGVLKLDTIVECNVTAGEIYDVACDKDTMTFEQCCTNSASVTCPTPSPTSNPIAAPTPSPTSNPTAAPTPSPTSNPTAVPTPSPTSNPTAVPTPSPTSNPTAAPTPSPTSNPTAAPTPSPTSNPTAAPTPSPTSSPTAVPTASPTKNPTKPPTNAEQAGYESSMTTTPTDAWIWTRDYSTCNRRRLEEETFANTKRGVRGAPRRRAQQEDNENADDVEEDGYFDSDEIRTSYRDDEDGVGDDVGEHANDPFYVVPAEYDDNEYDAITKESKEIRTSEPEQDGDVDEDKKVTTCVPATIPVGRQSTSITAAQTCPSSSSPFGGPVTVAQVNGRTVPESSGICASHVNPNTIWVHNDYSNHHSLFAVSTIDGSVRRYPISGGKNFDYEDIACGPGPIPGKGYVYIADVGDNYARRTWAWNPPTIYRVREPYLDTLEETSLTKWDKLELRYQDGPHNVEAMMIDPVSGRIIILTKFSGTIWITPKKWGLGNDSMTLQKVGRIKQMPDRLTGMDISPDGKELVVKFYDSINYYCMGTRQYNNPDGAWQDIVNALQQNDGIPVPYNEEPQGEAVCFGQDFNSGLYTLSEARGASTFPLINHERL